MKASQLVHEYARNKSVCRRYLLFKHFLYSSSKNPVTPCQCCDLCSPLCKCLHCNYNEVHTATIDTSGWLGGVKNDLAIGTTPDPIF